jgi:hypothetical protein
MNKDGRKQGGTGKPDADTRREQQARRPGPGATTITSKMSPQGRAVQRKPAAGGSAAPAARPGAGSSGDATRSLSLDMAHRGLSAYQEGGSSAAPAARPDAPAVQAKGRVSEDPASVHEAAAAGVSGASSSLPHFDQIQAAFGGHDLSQVRAHVGGEASAATEGMGATAYATGNHVAFRSQPDLHTAAHEVAHVVQQRQGVQLAGGVGKAGDAYERQADAVADRVVRGESAEALLGGGAGARPSAAQPGMALQAYEGFEHRDLGDRHQQELLAYLRTPEGEQWAQQAGLDARQLIAQMEADPLMSGGRLHGNRQPDGAAKCQRSELTPGEVIALMGDFYGSWEDLVNAPPAQVQGILRVMEQEEREEISLPEATSQYQELSGGGYLDLARQNSAHFAPGNRAEWRRLHQQAMETARQAGQGNAEQFNRALLIDSAACHFLTDAFAAGHLFDRGQVLAQIALHLEANPPQAENPEMQAYLGVIGASGDNMSQLVLKNIHDRMNHEGFMIENGRGMRWRTFGDDSLARSPEAQRMAALAVSQSRQQVIRARSGEPPNPDDVVALMPSDDTIQLATQQAIAYIPAAVREVEPLLYRNRALAPTQFGPILGTIVESNLGAIGAPGREQQILRLQEAADRRRDTLPVVAPQFQVFEW